MEQTIIDFMKIDKFRQKLVYADILRDIYRINFLNYQQAASTLLNRVKEYDYK